VAKGVSALAYLLAYPCSSRATKSSLESPESASDLALCESRLSESNRRPSHYE
jgi:hypothetical protein